MSNSRETIEAIETAKKIVKVQGNIFIRELLRQKKRSDSAIRLGVTKDDLLSNLINAIEQRRIGQGDLDEWIGEVEGWGKQHVYLYRITDELAADKIWAEPRVLQGKLKRARLDDGQTERLAFPETLALASAGFTDERFEVIWHERFELWNREKDRDLTGIRIDGDRYEFRAYRQEFSRSVMRFVLFPTKKRAALFLQIPLADKKHDAACKMARERLGEVFSWDALEPVSISDAIKLLDKAELKQYQAGSHGLVQAQNTKFAAPGATVEFEADPGNQVWKDVPAVRRVRNALQEDSFTGDSGKFRIQLRSGQGMNRDAIMSLNGKAKRVYLHSQMARDEVWIILDQIP